MKVSVTYTETVVRSVTVEIDTDTPLDELRYETLEHEARQQVFDEVEENGWDNEDVIENGFFLTGDGV